MNAPVDCRPVLEEALHALVTLNKLIASDGLSAYGDALSNGADNNGAWDIFRDQTFVINNTAVIAKLRAALSEVDSA